MSLRKKNKHGVLLEKVYFALAFELATSTRFDDDYLDYLTQVLIFDVYELAARKCITDLEAKFQEVPNYGSKFIFFKIIEKK